MTYMTTEGDRVPYPASHHTKGKKFTYQDRKHGPDLKGSFEGSLLLSGGSGHSQVVPGILRTPTVKIPL